MPAEAADGGLLPAHSVRMLRAGPAEALAAVPAGVPTRRLPLTAASGRGSVVPALECREGRSASRSAGVT